MACLVMPCQEGVSVFDILSWAQSNKFQERQDPKIDMLNWFGLLQAVRFI